jgi:hypothetical protein
MFSQFPQMQQLEQLEQLEQLQQSMLLPLVLYQQLRMSFMFYVDQRESTSSKSRLCSVDSILTCPHELSPHLEHVMHYLSPQEFKY